MRVAPLFERLDDLRDGRATHTPHNMSPLCLKPESVMSIGDLTTCHYSSAHSG
jgi:hypothetical protein